MRLIDAKQTKREITKYLEECIDNNKIEIDVTELQIRIFGIINNQPTAYDPEAVVAKLEEYKYSHLIERDSEMLEHCKEKEMDCEGSDCFLCVWDKATEIVNQLAEEYRQDLDKDSQCWIPTSERLPENNAIVLTCDKDGWISVKVNMPYAGVKNDFECGYYTAWMPLPPAYVPKEGRE